MDSGSRRRQPMVNVKLFVEGGGEHAREFRSGLGKFIEKAGAVGRMPRIVACGRRDNAYDKFRKAHGDGENAMLLVDAEEPVTAGGSWEHLKGRDNWDRPAGTTNQQCQLMVQVMETWFLADVNALESYYGQGFRRQGPPSEPEHRRCPQARLRNPPKPGNPRHPEGSLQQRQAQLRDTGKT